MAATQYNKYIWLVDTIRSAGKITKAEIDRRWLQKEVEPCVFEWFVAPTLDFIQQLRTFGSELEILQPQSLREQFKAELEKQLALYK